MHVITSSTMPLDRTACEPLFVLHVCARSSVADVYRVFVGARPPPQFDLASLLSQIQVPGSPQAVERQAPIVSLHDLLSTANTTPLVESMSQETVDSLLSNLPPAIVPAYASLGQKKLILTKVLRSPQFTQGAVSLTVALREGALRGVADSLKVPIDPSEEATGADPVEVFVEGVKREVDGEGEN